MRSRLFVLDVVGYIDVSFHRLPNTDASWGDVRSDAPTLSTSGCGPAGCPINPLFRYFPFGAPQGYVLDLHQTHCVSRLGYVSPWRPPGPVNTDFLCIPGTIIFKK